MLGEALVPVLKAEGVTPKEAAPEVTELCARAAQLARRHAEIVERFGRYPHRNPVLGRRSTAEELAFLKEPGSSF